MNRIERLINHFARLPGIGRKSASRVAYWLLEADKDFVQSLACELREFQAHVTRCRECGNYAEIDQCEICSSVSRDATVMCVVEHARDVQSIEATGEFHGIYHVLHGVLSPLDGIGPEELKLGKMLARIRSHGVQEIIVATNPTLEGDSTALYIVRMLGQDNVKITRIASGLPVGGDMEYADKLSISRALRARRDLA